MKITIYNPSVREGGTNNLLANLAVLLSSHDCFDVHYIEYVNGATIGYVSQHAPECKIVTVSMHDKVTVDDGVLILILLHAKLLSKKIIVSNDVRLLFWSTHPDDGIKLIPTFNLFYKKNEPIRSLIAGVVSPFQIKRIRAFIMAGAKQNGIVWMDHHNYESNNTFYNFHNNNAIIWPVITSSPSLIKKRVLPNKTDSSKINIVILGRLCDFKTIPILTLLDHILELKSRISLNFIGTGNYEPILKQRLEELGYTYRMLGQIDKDKLDAELLKYDILMGMGTSALEGAKLGIPSIVMNGCYKRNIHASILFEWIQNCPPFFLGEFVTDISSPTLSRTLGDLLSEFYSRRELLSERSFQCWNEGYSRSAFLDRAIHTITNNSFYYGKNKKYLQLTPLSKVVNYLKQKMAT